MGNLQIDQNTLQNQSGARETVYTSSSTIKNSSPAIYPSGVKSANTSVISTTGKSLSSANVIDPFESAHNNSQAMDMFDIADSDESWTLNSTQRNDSKMIEITVIDPVSRKKEVFKCDKVLLMSKMKFFELYNKEAIKTNASSQGIEDLDITIQCSILLFKFLIKYI